MPLEAFADALADRLQGLEAGPALGGMEPDARGRAVIDGHEDDGCPLGDGHGGRHVCAPHHVGRLGGDGPIVRPSAHARGPRAAGLGGRARASTGAPAPSRCAFPRPAASPRLFGRPHHETARLRAPGEGGPPGRRPGQRRSARGDDTVQETVSPAAAHTHWSGRGATRGRPAARQTPDGWRSTSGATHRVDLRRAKGPPASSWSTFAYSHSVSISSSPSLACSRRGSSSRASGARLFRPACPAARN